MVSLSNSPRVGTQPRLVNSQLSPSAPFSPSNPSSSVPALEIRAARLGDLRSLSAVLADSFYSRQGLMFLLYPLLRLGISEDLRVRLQSSVPHYNCLTAIAVLDAPQNPKTSFAKTPSATPKIKEVAGMVEIALRSRGKAIAENPINSFEDKSPSEQWQDRDRRDNLDRYPREYLYISNLAVSPVYRRQGIARKLLLSCEPLALQWGYQEIYLHVLDDNKQAKQLYLNLNYKIDRLEPRQTWFWSRSKCLLLRKSLIIDNR